MKKLIIILLIFLSSCHDELSLDSRLADNLETFKYEANKRGASYYKGNLKVTLKKNLSENEKVWGLCIKQNRLREIQIDEDLYYELVYENPDRLEALFFHECGHCLLDLKHGDKGIMKIGFWNGSSYKNNKEKELDLLFNKSK